MPAHLDRGSSFDCTAWQWYMLLPAGRQAIRDIPSQLAGAYT